MTSSLATALSLVIIRPDRRAVREPRHFLLPIPDREFVLQKFQNFSALMRGQELVVAPVALNPIMARMAQEAGFKAVYLSGGSLGWLKCVTEANLSISELIEVA